MTRPTPPSSRPQAIAQDHPVSEEVLRRVRSALEQLRYGSVEIVVHNGRVTQIERREKLRLDGA